MAKLVLSLNGVVQSEHALEKERTSLGRKSDNNIQVDNLAVSNKHALVITNLDDSFLEDLDSTNGTYVNGKLIKKHALKDGDVVGIGKHELKYVNEHATADEDFEKTMIIRPRSANVAVAAAKVAAESALAEGQTPVSTPPRPSGMPLGKLRVLDGAIAGTEFKLTKELVTLGKPGVQVAVISRRPQGYSLTHRESDGQNSNYPVVNGTSLGRQAYNMSNGDIIELAGVKMEFSVSG